MAQKRREFKNAKASEAQGSLALTPKNNAYFIILKLVNNFVTKF
jgi:hypothetical protein